jgi:carotenoid cleavage dioxygenase-like enzyme
VSPAAKGHPYRYAWGACATRPTNVANSLVKLDVESGTSQVWHEPGTLAGEPVFVPAPEPVSEDDGVVLATLVQADGTAALLALDGRTHTELARARLPYGLCTGFHGCWVPA